MPEGTNTEMPQTEKPTEGISRRDFLKKAGTLAVGAAFFPGDLLRKTGVEIPQDQTITRETAEMGKGMALALLNQVKVLDPKIADIVENAYKHTADITLDRDQNYKEALATFERIADSLLKWGAVRALNRLVDNQQIIYSWPDIREVIDEVIGTQGQPLSEFQNYFAKRKAIDQKDSQIERYFWRGIPVNDKKNIPAYSQPDYSGNINELAHIVGGFSGDNPEAIMGAVLKAPAEKPKAQDVSGYTNYLYMYLEIPLESAKGYKKEPDPFGWVGQFFGQKERESVFVRASDMNLTYR